MLRSSGAVGPETRPLCHVPEWVGDRVGGDNVDQVRAGPALCQVLSAGMSFNPHNNTCWQESLRVRRTGDSCWVTDDALHQGLLPTGLSSASSPEFWLVTLHFPPNTQGPSARMSQHQVETRGWWSSAKTQAGITCSRF